MVLALGDKILMDAGTINDVDDLIIGPSPYSTYSAVKLTDIVRRFWKKIKGTDISNQDLEYIINGTS